VHLSLRVRVQGEIDRVDEVAVRGTDLDRRAGVEPDRDIAVLTPTAALGLRRRN
jgi:hypothetical protein